MENNRIMSTFDNKISLLLQYLAWDSSLLGINSFRLQIMNDCETLEPVHFNQLQHTLKQLMKEPEIQFVCCRLNAGDILMIQQLEKFGFYTVDHLVTFRKKTLAFKSSLAPSSVRTAKIEDLPSIREMNSNFKMGRFHDDPRISDTLTAKVYDGWIQNSLTGRRADQVLVHENEEKKITGYISCILSTDSKGHRYGMIDLITVSPDFQGRGIGLVLLEKSFEYFISKQAVYVNVGTQAGNKAAVALYQKFGFKLHSIDVSFHYWNDNTKAVP